MLPCLPACCCFILYVVNVAALNLFCNFTAARMLNMLFVVIFRTITFAHHQREIFKFFLRVLNTLFFTICIKTNLMNFVSLVQYEFFPPLVSMNFFFLGCENYSKIEKKVHFSNFYRKFISLF